MTVPAANEKWIDEIFAAISNVLKRTGHFSVVNGGPIAGTPGGGITVTLWLQSISPAGMISGLDSSCALLVFVARMHMSMATQPLDAIDPKLTRAASNIIRMMHDDFDFDGSIRNVDLLGEAGQSLACSAGYLEQNDITYRVYDIIIPCLVNDVWPQVMRS